MKKRFNPRWKLELSCFSLMILFLMSGHFNPLISEVGSLDSMVDQNGGRSTNQGYRQKLKDALGEIKFLIPGISGMIHYEVVSNRKALAETDGKFSFIISDGFMSRIFDSEKNSQVKQGMLVFAVAHEIGHSIHRHSIPCPGENSEASRANEWAADAFGVFLVYAMGLSYDSPKEVFDMLQNPDALSGKFSCHGDPQKRSSKVYSQISKIEDLASQYREAIFQASAGGPESIEEAISKIIGIRAEMEKISGRSLPIFDFALGSAYHNLWIQKKNSPEDLLVLPWVYFPKMNLDSKNRSKGMNKVPGIGEYYYKARNFYKNFLEVFPDNHYAKLNQVLLTLYDSGKRDTAKKTLHELDKEKIDEFVFIHNLGTAYLYIALTNQEEEANKKAGFFLDKALSVIKTKPSEFPRQEANVYFNLAMLSKKEKKLKKFSEYSSIYLGHKGMDKKWANLLNEEKNDLKISTEQKTTGINEAGGFRLGSPKDEIMKKIMTNYEKEEKPVGKQTLLILRKKKEVFARLIFSSEKILTRIIFYPPSEQNINGIHFNTKKTELEKLMGLPDKIGENRFVFLKKNITVLFFPGDSNSSISEIILGNYE